MTAPRRLVLWLVVCAAATLVAACGDSGSDEVAELQQQIDELEAQLADAITTTSGATTSQSTTAAPTTTSTSTSTTIPPAALNPAYDVLAIETVFDSVLLWCDSNTDAVHNAFVSLYETYGERNETGKSGEPLSLAWLAASTALVNYDLDIIRWRTWDGAFTQFWAWRLSCQTAWDAR